MHGWLGGVIFGILLGIAAGAEGIAAGAGKDRCHYGAVLLCALKTGDNALDHLCGVGVILGGVIQGNPGAVHALYRVSVRVKNGFFLIHGARSFGAEVFHTP